MLVVGIAGGVASGKSVVAERFAQLGATVLDVDRIGHEVLRDESMRQSIRNRWGDKAFGEDGEVDRAAVAQIVFAASESESANEDLRFLEQMTFPQISQRIVQQIERLDGLGATPVVILDAAVMFKAGWDRFCNKILYVEVPRQQRLDRAKLRGWTPQQFSAREAAQVSLETKRSKTCQIIDNSGTIKETNMQIDQFWQSLDIIPPNLSRPS